VRLYLLFFSFSIAIAGCSQEPEWRYIPLTDTVTAFLGNTAVPVLKHRYSPHITTPFFVHLHHNEQTADSALHSYLALNGGKAIGIYNNRQRFINFTLGQKAYLFDPNRMFTPAGIKQSLQLLSSYHPQAAQAIVRFSDSVRHSLPIDELIIAVHNNTDAAYSILSYAAGGTNAAEAKAFFRNPEMDVDDFVLTTDPQLFDKLKAASINAVLQDNDRVFDDGSLGYYLGKQGRRYVNIEAEHGHFWEQMQLIKLVLAAFNNKPDRMPQMLY
jgi:hypothetical protein